MSFWIRTRGKDGGDRLVGVNLPLELAIILPCLIMCTLITFLYGQSLRYGPHAIALLMTGVLCLAISKTNQFRKGKWFKWGTKDMSMPRRILYYMGYGLISVGVVFACNFYLKNS
jgi:hypothetical protein